jgi:hypothetical protein
MRTILMSVALLTLAGCAGQPAAPDAPAAKAAAPAPEGTKLATTDLPEAKTLADAQKLGYKVVNEDGKTLYCRETKKLGSHIQKEKTCMTAAELRMLQEASQRGFDDMKRAIPPPHGT